MALVDLKSNLANFRSDFKTPSVESQTVKKLNQPTAVKDTFRPTDSKMDIDTIPKSYIRKTQFTKAFVDRSSFDRADDYILKYTGRTRFTLKTINTSKFNIDSGLTKFSVNGKSKLSDKKFVNAYSRFNIDSTPNKFSSVGKSKLSDVKIINTSLFNIDSTPNKFSSVGKSKLSDKNIVDSSLYNIDTKLIKFSQTGIYAPSKFNNTKVVNTSKFNLDSNPAKFVANGKKPSKYNSSKPIDALYKKFNEQHNLREDAFNYSYIKHPLILRGIQRKGKERPNRWGVDALVNLDSGLVRGGITAALDRAANDTARIAKWMASPKGIMWVIKQVGLGLTNPKVEATGGILTRQTRIHTGVASLLSVPGTAFGLHFTRHGIPFVNETASYEKVIKSKQDPLTGNPNYSRLVSLKEEYGTGKSYTNKVQDLLVRAKILKTKGFGSTILSGLGGSSSVYGLGYTTIRRATDTFTESVKNAKDQNFHAIYSAQNPYDIKLANSTYSATKLEPKPNKQPDTNLIDKSGNPIGKLEDILSDAQEAFNEINKPRKPTLFGLASRYLSSRKINGPTTKKSIYRPKKDPNDVIDEAAKNLIKQKAYELNLYVSSLKAKTGKSFDSLNSSGELRNVNQLDSELPSSLRQITEKASGGDIRKNKITLPNSNVQTLNPFNRKHEVGDNIQGIERRVVDNDIRNYATMAYGKIPNRAKDKTSIIDFRNSIPGATGTFIGKQDADYYKDRNLEGHYGFSKASHHPDVKARGETSFFDIATNKSKFTGDKVNAIDIIKAPTDPGKIYPDDANDFIKFYFADGDMPGETQLKNIMVFRSTITGLSETFSPGWDSIQIMGRPDSVYRYSSFERSISFSFKVAAMSRAEMIPLWRKLNYLASYTMPDWSSGLAGGPFMRLTLGDLYQNCPGFIESLSYTYPDDGVWDINDDKLDLGKQLPTIVEVNVGYKIIGKYRPQNMGRVFALSKNDTKSAKDPGQWLTEDIQYPEVKEGPPDPDPSTTSPSF